MWQAASCAGAFPGIPAAAQTAAAVATANGAAPAATGAAMQGTTTNSASPLLAQTVPPPPPGTEEPQLQEVVVTGFRESLTKATQAKRDAIGFTDLDLLRGHRPVRRQQHRGVLQPASSPASPSFATTPTREWISPSAASAPDFTKVLLNGAPIAVASTGPTDAQNTNQEVDLNMFPTELFTSLTVEKTSAADMLEGGAAGTVNMRSARPFDTPGRHVAFGAQGTKNQNAGAWGNHDYVIASDTFDNGFGVLVGGVATHNNVGTPGFETIGWTNAHLAAAQCTGEAEACNSTGGGNFSIPSTVDAATLLADNPGASLEQINNGILPRLGRDAYEFGFEDTYNGIFSLEYRPSDALHFYMDNMFGKEHNDLQREDAWTGHCATATPRSRSTRLSTRRIAPPAAVTSGTFEARNSFLEYRPYFEYEPLGHEPRARLALQRLAER